MSSIDDLLRGLGPTTMTETIYIAARWPFRDPDRGRCWHARHETAQERGKYCASSLCGTNLLSTSDTLDDDFPPKSSNHRACSKCLFLADPSTLSARAFTALQNYIANRSQRRNTYTLNELIARDYLAREPGSDLYLPTKLGWRAWRALKSHPAFDPELLREFPDE